MGGYGLRFKPADFALDLEGRHGDIPKFKKAGVRLVFSSIAHLVPTLEQHRSEQLAKGYGSSIGGFRIRSPTLMAIEHIKTYYTLVKQHRDNLKLVLSREDVETITTDERMGFLIAIEGAEPLEDVGDLELFYRLGLRSLQLTWNFDNKYAATCMSKKDYGLTGDGELLIQLCNELGIIVDLAHASKKTTLEALAASKLPTIVSHANSNSVNKHARNLDDEQLQAVKNNRGVVGITLINPTIGEKPSVKTLADHITYIYEHFGPDILGIGTDFFGLLNLDEPKGLENITKLDNLWEELLNRGLKKSDIDKIAYQNALRVIIENAAKWKNNP